MLHNKRYDFFCILLTEKKLKVTLHNAHTVCQTANDNIKKNKEMLQV